MKRPSLKALQAKVDKWNAKHAPGTKVKVLLDSGKTVNTKTRSKAEMLGGHTPVVWLDCISGCYCLDRVSPL